MKRYNITINRRGTAPEVTTRGLYVARLRGSDGNLSDELCYSVRSNTHEPDQACPGAPTRRPLRRNGLIPLRGPLRRAAAHHRDAARDRARLPREPSLRARLHRIREPACADDADRRLPPASPVPRVLV